MDMIPRNDYGERCQFDAYCKLVLYHEAIDYLREMQRRRDRELSFSDLPQMEMDKLCVVDHYPSDRFTFSSHGYDLHIENELVADAFAGLSVQDQSILILHFVLDLPDQEVGRLVGMSRSAVQRRRAKSLNELRIIINNCYHASIPFEDKICPPFGFTASFNACATALNNASMM